MRLPALLFLAALGSACTKEAGAPAAGAGSGQPVGAEPAAPGDGAAPAGPAAPSGSAAAPGAEPAAPATAPGTPPPSPAAATAPGAVAPGPSTPAGADASPPAPRIELLAPGDEPRFELRYRPVAGARDGGRMTTNGFMEMPGQPKSTIPTVVVQLATEVLEVAPDGTVSARTTVADIGLENPSVPGGAAIANLAGQMKGVSTTTRMSARGELLSNEVSGVVDPKLLQLMGGGDQGFTQSATVFPAEPLGRGARWRSSQRVGQGAIVIEQVMTFEVLEVDAAHVTLKATGTMTAPPQALPEAPGARLEKMEGALTTTQTIHFDRIVHAVELKMDVTSTISSSGQTLQLRQGQQVTLTPR